MPAKISLWFSSSEVLRLLNYLGNDVHLKIEVVSPFSLKVQ